MWKTRTSFRWLKSANIITGTYSSIIVKWGNINATYSRTYPLRSCEKDCIKNQWGRREIWKFWISCLPQWHFVCSFSQDLSRYVLKICYVYSLILVLNSNKIWKRDILCLSFLRDDILVHRITPHIHLSINHDFSISFFRFGWTSAAEEEAWINKCNGCN